MILTEEWKKEGEIKGFEKGKKQAIEQVAVKMLLAGCEDRLILETTALSFERLQASKAQVGKTRG